MHEDTNAAAEEQTAEQPENEPLTAATYDAPGSNYDDAVYVDDEPRGFRCESPDSLTNTPGHTLGK